MRYYLFFLAVIFYLESFSQNNDLSISSIVNHVYNPERIESVKQLKNSKGFTRIKIDYEKKISFVLYFDYKLKKIDTLISSLNSQIPFFTEYYLSRDEKKILLETETDKIYRRSKQSIYYVYEIKSKKINKVFVDKIQEPLFSPNGKKVAFIYRRNIYIKDLLNNKTEKITNDGSYQILNGISDWVYEEEFGFVRAFDWSPDSNNIAYIKFDESEVPIFSMDIYGSALYQFPYMFRYPKAGEKNSIVNIKLYNIKSKKTVKIEFEDNNPYYIPRIKFDLTYNKLYVQTINRLQNHLKLWKINIIDNEPILLLEEKDKYYVSIHDDLKVLNDQSFLWTSERDGFNHIYHYSKNGKLINQITKGLWDVTSLYRYNEKSKEIYYQSVQNGSINRTIHSISLNGKKIKNFGLSKGFNGANFSFDGKYFIYSYSDEKTPPVYYLSDSHKGNKIKELLNNWDLKLSLSKFKLPNKEFSEIQINGENLNMWILKPNNFSPNKNYPVLMYQYSGPGSQQVANRWGNERSLWHKMLANMGYVIVCVDGRGTGFKGSEFKKMTYLNLVKYETIDQINVAKKIGELPYVDSERIGIWGWSFGGHMATNCLLKGNDIFSMAIAVAPVTNWRFYDTIYTERFMRTPQENPDGYDLNSPINYADRLKGKFLIIHGSADDNVHVQNTMRMVEALIQNDKQFEWMIYPDKNHGIYGGNTTKHLYTKMTNFILNNL